MFPATRSIQKEMLPIVDRDGLTKPTIQIIIEECLSAGIEEVCIVVEKDGQGPFREHFRPLTEEETRVFAGKDWAIQAGKRLGEISERISYVEQPSPQGFGHAVYQTKEWVNGESFVLLLGDHIYTTPDRVPSPVAQIIQVAAETSGNVTGVRLDRENEVGVTGIIRGRLRDHAIAADAPGQSYDILALKEKPTPEEARENLRTEGVRDGYYLGHFGIHLFTSEIFESLGYLIANDIRVKNEFQLTSGQELLLRRSLLGEASPYSAAFLNASRWDIGMPDVYLESFAAYGMRGPFADRLKTIVND